MRTDELIRKLQKNIKTQLSHRDLMRLCTFMNTSITGRKNQVQDKLVEFIQNQSYETLITMSNKIDDYLRVPTSNRPRQVTTPKLNPEILTDVILRSAPVNLEDEVPPNLRLDLSNPYILPQVHSGTRLPTHPIQNGIERTIDMPNILASTQIATSPFYCCSVCLQPLTLLKPQYTPNTTHTNRQNSRFNDRFNITENVKNILSRNQYYYQNKVEHKWQILLRFVGIDPNKMSTNPQEKVTETIPPYLVVAVNDSNQNLWDILPSNSKQKEGKRHPKPVNISDKLILNKGTNIYQQDVHITWWQTPTVFMYYYMGVYLERKLTVREMMTLYAPNSFFNNRSVEETMKLIESKLGGVSKTSKKDDDDDLVISNVLPINLCCPVGKSRITIPLRTVNCQHLQCFDAHLFLSMNERRPVWKCPVCDSRATPDDLFRDKYFQKILDTFKDDDDVADVNVNPDYTFVAMKRNKDREQVENQKANEISVPIQNLDQSEQDLIVLDSDEETEPSPPKTSVQPKVTLPQPPPPPAPKDLSTPKSNAPQPPPYPLPMPQLINKDLPVEKDHSIQRVNNNSLFGTSNQVPISVNPEIESRNIASPNINVQISKSPSNQISNNNQGNIFSSVTRPNLTNTMQTNVSMPSRLSNYLTTTNSNLLPPISLGTPKTTQPTITTPGSLFRSSNLTNSFMTCAITPPSILNSTLSTTTTNHQNSPTTNIPTVPSAFGNPISVIGTKAVVDLNASNAKSPFPSLNSDTATPKKATSSEVSSSQKDRFATRKSNDQEISREFSNVPNPLSVSSSSAIHSQPIVRTPSIFTAQKSDNGSLRNNNVNDGVDDVVRTLPVSNMPDLSSKNRITDSHSPEPIVCPNVVIQIPEKKTSKADNTLSQSPSSPGQNKKIENQKKSKFLQSKIPPPAPSVAIPSVTIDLTEEDDEVTTPINLKPSNLFASNSLNWVSVNAPIPSNLNTGGIHNSKLSLYNYNNFLSNKDRERGKLSAIGIGHFKPHHMRFNNNNIPSKVNKTSCPIDLTGDDDDEDHIPQKRQRINHVDDTEDGQVEDSDEDSSSTNYSPSVIDNNSSSLNRNVQKNPCPVVSKKKL